MPIRKTPFKPTLSIFSDPPPAVALSLILPCYKAAELARRSVMRLTHALAGRIPSYEIIVVDDGIGDCEPIMRDLPTGPGGQVHVITLPQNRGKGGAVAAGMKSASGRVRVFTDVDIPYGTTPVMLIEAMIRTRDFHMVIGDRTFPQSRYETELPFARKIASGVFSRITATMVTGGFFDTQCGLKGFRGDIAEALFGLQTVERFAFDVELLYLALTYGLEIKRIPVVLEANGTSSVRIGRDSTQTLFDLGRIKTNQWRGVYESDLLRGLIARECAVASMPLRTPSIAHAALKVRA
jgi:glycosyltransferase involved in cell wall biosynthesis